MQGMDTSSPKQNLDERCSSCRCDSPESFLTVENGPRSNNLIPHHITLHPLILLLCCLPSLKVLHAFQTKNTRSTSIRSGTGAFLHFKRSHICSGIWEAYLCWRQGRLWGWADAKRSRWLPHIFLPPPTWEHAYGSFVPRRNKILVVTEHTHSWHIWLGSQTNEFPEKFHGGWGLFLNQTHLL